MDLGARDVRAPQLVLGDRRALLGMIVLLGFGFLPFLQGGRLQPNRPAQRRFQRNRMNRQDQHEPSHAPHALPSPPRTPRMSSSVKTRIKSDIVNEPWTTGREVVINEESNTISLFDVDDTVSHRSRQREVPLRYLVPWR